MARARLAHAVRKPVIGEVARRGGDSIEPAQFAVTEQFAPMFGATAAEAWLATITRV